jgi:hypothetical protein
MAACKCLSSRSTILHGYESEEEGRRRLDGAGAGAGAVSYIPIRETVRAYLRADRAWPYVGKPPKINCKTWPHPQSLTTHQAAIKWQMCFVFYASRRTARQAGRQAGSLPL